MSVDHEANLLLELSEYSDPENKPKMMDGTVNAYDNSAFVLALNRVMMEQSSSSFRVIVAPPFTKSFYCSLLPLLQDPKWFWLLRAFKDVPLGEIGLLSQVDNSRVSQSSVLSDRRIMRLDSVLSKHTSGSRKFEKLRNLMTSARLRSDWMEAEWITYLDQLENGDDANSVEIHIGDGDDNVNSRSKESLPPSQVLECRKIRSLIASPNPSVIETFAQKWSNGLQAIVNYILHENKEDSAGFNSPALEIDLLLRKSCEEIASYICHGMRLSSSSVLIFSRIFHFESSSEIERHFVLESHRQEDGEQVVRVSRAAGFRLFGEELGRVAKLILRSVELYGSQRVVIPPLCFAATEGLSFVRHTYGMSVAHEIDLIVAIELLSSVMDELYSRNSHYSDVYLLCDSHQMFDCFVNYLRKIGDVESTVNEYMHSWQVLASANGKPTSLHIVCSVSSSCHEMLLRGDPDFVLREVRSCCELEEAEELALICPSSSSALVHRRLGGPRFVAADAVPGDLAFRSHVDEQPSCSRWVRVEDRIGNTVSSHESELSYLDVSLVCDDSDYSGRNVWVPVDFPQKTV